MDLQTVTATAVMHPMGFKEQRLIQPLLSLLGRLVNSVLLSPHGKYYSHIALTSGCEELYPLLATAWS